MNSHLQFHRSPDVDAARRLLEAVDLPVDDLGDIDLDDFIGCGSGDELFGLVGLEVGGDVALLRSLAVSPAMRGVGLGNDLVRRAERHAAERGARAIYILTLTAATFFRRLGYVDVPRDRAPVFIRRTREFSGICPDSAAFMVKKLVPLDSVEVLPGD